MSTISICCRFDSSNPGFTPWPWFIAHPCGHIGPHCDGIRVCQELPPLLHPRWASSIVDRCRLCSSSSFVVDLVLSCRSWYLPVQCLLHSYNTSKPVKSSFSQYVVHGLLSSSTMTSTLVILSSQNAYYAPMPPTMSSIQSFWSVISILKLT